MEEGLPLFRNFKLIQNRIELSIEGNYDTILEGPLSNVSLYMLCGDYSPFLTHTYSLTDDHSLSLFKTG